MSLAPCFFSALATVSCALSDFAVSVHSPVASVIGLSSLSTLCSVMSMVSVLVASVVVESVGVPSFCTTVPCGLASSPSLAGSLQAPSTTRAKLIIDIYIYQVLTQFS